MGTETKIFKMQLRNLGSAIIPWQVCWLSSPFLFVSLTYHESGQDRFSDSLDNFEEYVISNAPVDMADPEVDPYVTGSLNPSNNKARMRFSDVAEFAEEQFRAPLPFRH